MYRRTLVLALVLLIASASAARAERTAVTVIAVPAYILSTAAWLTGCVGGEEGEEASDFARDGLYLGAGATYAAENFQFEFTRLSRTRVKIDNSWGANARLGYRCHPRVAIETEYEWLEGFDLSGAQTIKGWQITLNAKLFVLTGRIQPYFLSGLGAMHVSEENDVTMRLGGGVDLYATRNVVFSVDASYMNPHENVGDFEHIAISWGLQYRF